MIWPEIPKRLQSALKGLCCLAKAESSLRARQVAERIGVSPAETSKVLQLMVWGGFVTSRRGSHGGFQLAVPAAQITTGDVVSFFFRKQPKNADGDCLVMRILRDCGAPCQKAFARLTLADIVAGRTAPCRKVVARKAGKEINGSVVRSR